MAITVYYFYTKSVEICEAESMFTKFITKVDAMKSKNSSREIYKEKRQDDTFWTVGAEAWYPNELKNIHKNQHLCDYFN